MTATTSLDPLTASEGPIAAGGPSAGRVARVALRTRGQRHGPITRLVSPGDVGGHIKPFVFLDRFEADPASAPRFGWHPHSGIATLTLLLEGQASYEETTGVKGILEAGGIEWMRAGGGVWHTSGFAGRDRIKGFQLWVALPPELENGPHASQYLHPTEVPSSGPTRIVLGSFNGVHSPILAPTGINYLDVRLRAGERWSYPMPAGHDVAWLSVYRGGLCAPQPVDDGELVVVDAPGAATPSLEFEAGPDTAFILGSARKHPHELVLGYYSVHTSVPALARGEAEIERIGTRLQAAGILR
jgi:redox-sensitive bicupin YhaK (pirin superfamily)